MKNILFVLFPIISFNLLFGAGIQFESTLSWEQTLTKAQKENKIIFVVAYSTSCPNCDFMENNVYPQSAVGHAYNDKYLNVKMDMDSDAGMAFSMEYEIMAYPTYLFIDPQGNTLHQKIGTMTSEQFIVTANRANQSEYQFFTLKEKFESGQLSGDLLLRLSKMAMEQQNNDLLNRVNFAYLKTQQNWLTDQNMNLILSSLQTIEQETFAFLLKHQKAFEAAYGQGRIKTLLDEITLRSLSLQSYDYATRNFDLEKARHYGRQYLPETQLNEAMSIFKINKLIREENTQGFFDAAIEHFELYTCYNGYFLNNIALGFYESTDDIALLEKALDWSLQSIALEDRYEFNDTAAALFYKLGNKPQARLHAKKSIEQAEAAGLDTSDTRLLLVKIELMK